VHLPNTGSLVTRSWNDTPIARRTTDGYVNATAMCKANGKRWSDYRESDRCQQYLDALEAETGISGFDLIQSSRGGTGSLTMVHPQVAVDLARWISAPFAVWMDGWFLEGFERVSHVRDTQPVLSPEQQKLEWLMGFCSKWQVQLDARDMLHIKEHARSLALPPAGQGQTVFNDYPVSRLVQDLFGVVLSNAKYSTIGRLLAKMWRAEHNGENPPRHDQYVDGACRAVAHYPREWAEPALKVLQKENPTLFQR